MGPFKLLRDLTGDISMEPLPNREGWTISGRVLRRKLIWNIVEFVVLMILSLGGLVWWGKGHLESVRNEVRQETDRTGIAALLELPETKRKLEESLAREQASLRDARGRQSNLEAELQKAKAALSDAEASLVNSPATNPTNSKLVDQLKANIGALTRQNYDLQATLEQVRVGFASDMQTELQKNTKKEQEKRINEIANLKKQHDDDILERQRQATVQSVEVPGEFSIKKEARERFWLSEGQLFRSLENTIFKADKIETDTIKISGGNHSSARHPTETVSLDFAPGRYCHLIIVAISATSIPKRALVEHFCEKK